MDAKKGIQELLSKPVWQMTGEELLLLNQQTMQNNVGNNKTFMMPASNAEKKYVYGISGIAKLFCCCRATAHRIKKSGKIDSAIKQIGRKIIVDADLALELAGRKTGGRR